MSRKEFNFFLYWEDDTFIPNFDTYNAARIVNELVFELFGDERENYWNTENLALTIRKAFAYKDINAGVLPDLVLCAIIFQVTGFNPEIYELKPSKV